MNRHGLALTICLSLALFAGEAYGQSVSNDELIAYARAAAAGQATEKQKAILFLENRRVNNLAMANRIPDADYQLNQQAFVAKNDELIRAASEKTGLSVEPTKDRTSYTPGTDTDRQLQNPRGSLTVDNVKAARQEYNRLGAEYLRSQGVEIAAGTNLARQTTTDIMPSPYDMKPGEFKKANEYINAEGGLAYTSADAAKVQLSLDGGVPRPPDAHEISAFEAEMQKKTVLMDGEIRRFYGERSKASTPDEIENIDIEISKHTAFMSKYLDRAARGADLVRVAGTDEPLSEDVYARASREKISRAMKRDASKTTKQAEVFVGAVSEHLARNATRKFSDAVAGAATAGGNVEAGQKIIADTLKNLPPTQKAQAIADLEIKYGGEFARGVNAELKKKPAAPSGTTVGSALNLVNTVLNVRNQYAEGKTTTRILWDMSIGATLESTRKETAEYTSKEIDRLKMQYLAAGEDIDSTYVKLKIMGEATVKGTFHGTMIGGYDLLKSATHTAAGAAVTAADSAIFLVGEALDTRNVLETSFAEIQAQNMEQSVQNAKALKFGKDAVAELKRLSGQAAYLKTVLEQNTRSARQSCREADEALAMVKADIEAVNGLKESDALKTLPDTQRRLTRSFTEMTSDMQKLLRQAQAAERDVTTGGDRGAALLALQVLSTSCDRHAGALDAAKKDLVLIGSMASLKHFAELLAGLETAKASLLERGRLAVSNAEAMRKNEDAYKKTLASFDAIRNGAERAGGFFAGKRESDEADWMVIRSKLAGITRPDGKMPEDFFGEVGTLERLPDKIREETGRLKPAAGTSSAETAQAGTLAETALAQLTPLYNAATQALAGLRAALDSLRAAASRTTPKPEPPAKPQPPKREPAKPKPPEPPRVQQPPKSDGRLPCGHMPGECGKNGIKSIKCMLHSGAISTRKD
ncbi:MAG TPA: hypothetical protein PLP29_00220 [Candidatus Ozemobacteraceae bacterium]|nr:hypothetical protein [Candidatus Ozemobacteraceae bacterium]